MPQPGSGQVCREMHGELDSLETKEPISWTCSPSAILTQCYTQPVLYSPSAISAWPSSVSSQYASKQPLCCGVCCTKPARWVCPNMSVPAYSFQPANQIFWSALVHGQYIFFIGLAELKRPGEARLKDGICYCSSGRCKFRRGQMGGLMDNTLLQSSGWRQPSEYPKLQVSGQSSWALRLMSRGPISVRFRKCRESQGMPTTPRRDAHEQTSCLLADQPVNLGRRGIEKANFSPTLFRFQLG